MPLPERGREIGPDLPEDDRQREREARVEAHLHRGHERLRDPERHRLASPCRQRLIEPVQQLVMEPVGHRETHGKRQQDHDQPGAELAEMIDEPRSLFVAETPR